MLLKVQGESSIILKERERENFNNRFKKQSHEYIYVI